MWHRSWGPGHGWTGLGLGRGPRTCHRPSVGMGCCPGLGTQPAHTPPPPRSLAGPLAGLLAPPAGLPAQGSQWPGSEFGGGTHEWVELGPGTGGREEPGPICMLVPNIASSSPAALHCPLPSGRRPAGPALRDALHRDMGTYARAFGAPRHPDPAEVAAPGTEGLAEGQQEVPAGTQPQRDPLRGWRWQ